MTGLHPTGVLLFEINFSFTWQNKTPFLTFPFWSTVTQITGKTRIAS